MKEKHPISGEPPSVPAVEKPVVSEEVKGHTVPSQPSAGTRTNAKHPEKEYIPIHGGSSETLGHTYPEMPVRDAVEDKGAHKRAVTPQILQHPVAVPKNMRNNNS